jgi:PAS domain S-box-containing protein
MSNIADKMLKTRAPFQSSASERWLLEVDSHQLDNIFDNLDRAIRVIDKDFRVIRINRAFSEMAGIKPEEAIGKKCSDVFHGPFCQTPQCRLNRILNGEHEIHTETVRESRDGRNVPCSVNAIPLLDHASRVNGIIEIFRDLSDRYKYEQMLQESEERYHTVVDLQAATGEAIVMLQDIDGIEGRYAFYSEQWPNMIGYSSEELQKISAFTLLAPEHRAERLERYKMILSGQLQESPIEVELIRKDGCRMPVEILTHGTVFKGKPATVAYIRDISERRKLRQQVVDQKNRYQSLFEHSPVATAEADMSGVKRYLDHLRANGVTDLRAYLRQNPDDILLSHDYFRLWELIAVNHATYSMLEQKKDNDTINREYSEQIKTDPGVYENHVSYLEAFFKGETLFENEMSTTTIGHTTHVQIKVSVPPGYEDTLSRVFITHHDVSSLRETEKRLKEHQQRLEERVEQRTDELRKEILRRQQEEERSRKLYESECQLRNQVQKQLEDRMEFTRAVVHEIKTPLSSIIASSEALQDGIEESKARLARNVLNASLTLNRRVDELLEISKGAIGMLHLRYSLFSPQLLTEQVCDLLRPGITKKGQTLILEIEPGVPNIEADYDRLQQVLTNLISNAIRFNKPTGHIILRVRQTGTKVHFEVEDEGVGISSEEQAVLFDPDRRSKLRKNYGGLGLGLALSKMFVELHRGSIGVNSLLGSGSRFYFSVPIAPSQIGAVD